MKRKRANVFIIDNRKDFRRKLERANPELKDVNMGIDRTLRLKNVERKVA